MISSPQDKRDAQLAMPLAHELDPNEFIAQLKTIFPRRKELFLQQMEVFFSLILVPLFINAVRLYPEKKQEYLSALLSNIEVACSIPLTAIEALAVNGAVVSTQPGATTTPLCLALIPASLFLFIYKFTHYSLVKNDIKTFIAKSNLQHSENANDIYQLTINRQQINQIKQNGINKDALDMLEIRPSTWQTISRGIYRANRNSAKYGVPINILASVIGLYKMIIAAETLKKDIDCSLWTLLFDTCNTTGQAYMSMLQIYPWLYFTTARASLQVAGTVGYLSTATLPPCRKLGTLFFNHIHQPYERFFNLRTEDEAKWHYKTLFWNIAFYSPFTLAALALLFVRAWNLANQYAYDHHCPSVGETIQLLYTNSSPPNPACTREEMVNVLAWLVVKFECDNIYPVLLTLWLSSYLSAAIAERYTTLKQNISAERVSYFNNRFTDIHLTGTKAGLVGSAIGTSVFIYFIRAFGSDMLQSGLKAYYDSDALLPGAVNSSDLLQDYVDNHGNTTLEENFQRICPYADLTGYLKNKLSSGTLDTFQYHLINNGSGILSDVTAGCENLSIENLGWRNFVGLDMACDPKLTYRVMMVLFMLFYTDVFVTFSVPYLLTALTMLMAWALRPSANQQPVDTPDEEKPTAIIELAPFVDSQPIEEFSGNEAVNNAGCFARFFNRIYSATPLANQSRVGYQKTPSL